MGMSTSNDRNDIQPPRPGPMSRAPDDAMSALLARNWWAVGLRGVFTILFGLAALALPLATIQALVLLFAAYMLVDGVFAIIAGVRAATQRERWGMLILEGVVNLGAAAAALLLPELTVVVLVAVLGAWSVISGVVLAVAAFRLHGTHGRGWLAFAGLLSVLWGVMLMLSPVVGAIVLTWWLGGYALVFGVLMLVVAFRLRQRRDPLKPARSVAS